jgi:hypothetical protein
VNVFTLGISGQNRPAGTFAADFICRYLNRYSVERFAI